MFSIIITKQLTINWEPALSTKMRSFTILVAMFTVTVGSEIKATGFRNFEDEKRNIEHTIQVVDFEKGIIDEDVEEGSIPIPMSYCEFLCWIKSRL